MRAKIFRSYKMTVSLALAAILTLGVVADTTKTFALDYEFYSKNDALLYDPTYQASCASGGGTLVGENTQEKIWNFFLSEGLTPEQAAGLMGNMEKESGFSPTAQQKPGQNLWDNGSPKGWGLVQWDGGRRFSSPNGGVLGNLRKEKPDLIQYLALEFEGMTEPDGNFAAADFDALLLYELEYMVDESEGRRVTATQFSGSADTEWARMKEQATLREATLFWERNFEVSGDPNIPGALEGRVDKAEAIFAKFSSKSPATGSPTGCPGYGEIQQYTLQYAWPEYHSPPYPTKKPEYQQAVKDAQADGRYVGGLQYPGVDCGGFVTLLVTNSGHDPEYNYDGRGGNTTDQLRWLRNNWRELGKGGDFDTAELEPGDVAIRDGHTYIYVGEIADFGEDGIATPGIASASISYTGESWRAPMAGGESLTDPDYFWYTKR